MAEELAYAIITPHSIEKSRTGNIISRILSRSGLELVAGSVFHPSRELAEGYAEMRADDLIRAYIQQHLAPGGDGKRRRVLMLVLRGEDAVERLGRVVGMVGPAGPNEIPDSVRGTYGELVRDASGAVVFFEPAVLTARDAASSRRHLELWAEYAERDGGLRCGMGGEGEESTLVLIKPDNLRFPSFRPGALIDVFARTGLRIVGFKVHRMSVAEAEAFYGPVLEVLQQLYTGSHGERSRALLEREFGIPLGESAGSALGEVVGPLLGRDHWENLIEFMSGRRPSETPEGEKLVAGTQKTIALVYEGAGAVGRVREVLGPTDPDKAPVGTIRREFGQSVMVNAAHASDSVENARSEMALLGLEHDHFGATVREFYETLDEVRAPR